MGINLQTKKLQESIVKLINGAGLPAANVLFVVENIYHEVVNLYENNIKEELLEEKEDK